MQGLNRAQAAGAGADLLFIFLLRHNSPVLLRHSKELPRGYAIVGAF